MGKSSPDSASGPSAGYIFQFEKALVMLASLESPDDYISVEEIDDVATHAKDGTALITIQAKHSIASSGTTFEDTSPSLWKTLVIWVKKLKAGKFDSSTEFVCCTNKLIPQDSLLKKITRLSFDDLLKECQSLLATQKGKLKNKIDDNPGGGKSIKETIQRINEVLDHEAEFKIIKKNLKIHDAEDPKSVFFNKVHLGGTKFSDSQKEFIYETFYGWLTLSLKAKWKNGNNARISKMAFNDKLYSIMTNTLLICAVFRTKESIGSVCEEKILEKRKELFVRQIEDIKRNKNARERIIRDAIIDFLYTEIELKYLVEKGDYTEYDFNSFLDECFRIWQSEFDQLVLNDLEEYGEAEKNEIAIRVYDTIMNKVQVLFMGGIPFNTQTKYMKNGAFLKLSNIPMIGWAPDWEKRYSL